MARDPTGLLQVPVVPCLLCTPGPEVRLGIAVKPKLEEIAERHRLWSLLGLCSLPDLCLRIATELDFAPNVFRGCTRPSKTQVRIVAQADAPETLGTLEAECEAPRWPHRRV